MFDQASQKPHDDPKLRPTIFNRPKWHDGSASSPITSPNTRFNATQTFNSLHKVYGNSLNPDRMKVNPFYAVSEIYSFYAAAENQFLKRMEKILDERVKSIVEEGLQTKSSSLHALPERTNLQYDRSILEAHSDRISDIVAFLKAADDPVWFPPSPEHTAGEAIAARISLLQDFHYLHTQVVHLVQRCQWAMDIVAHNASLLEAKESNSQSKDVSRLTLLTTGLTLVYAPLSLVCAFFGMNFSLFGQGDQPLWIFAAAGAPVLLISLILLRKWTSTPKKEASQKY